MPATSQRHGSCLSILLQTILIPFVKPTDQCPAGQDRKHQATINEAAVHPYTLLNVREVYSRPRPSISEPCGLCIVAGPPSIDEGGLKAILDPPLGVTENLKSAIAASKSVHATEPRASDLENKVLNSIAVASLTLNSCVGSVAKGCGASGGDVIVYTDGSEDRVLSLALD